MFIVNQQRQEYTPEYRREAANLVIESHRPIAHVAKEIGVAPGLLGRWVKNERERRGPRMGSARRIFVLRMFVCVVSWQMPRWIMSFCHKRQPSSL
ncbi:transposase [Corynebacterium macginleyi]|uniref:transposase n=1 Tax=Corynebacterium macginleyi TaxID=38290 RepID=UPI001F3EAA16|nr:transposase [Corynebacterium macginleyi]